MVAATQHLSTLPRGLEALGAMLQQPEQDDAAATIVKAAVALATTAAGGPDGPAQAEEALARGHLLDAEPSIAIGMAITSLVWGDRLEAALAAWDEVVERATARSEPLRLAFALTFRGGVHLRAGRLADAEADERAALDVPQQMWTASAVPVDIHALLAETLLERSGPDAAGEALEAARARRAAVRLPGQQHRPDGARPDPLRARRRPRRPSRTCSSSGAAATPGRCATRRRSRGARTPPSRCGRPTPIARASWPTRRSSWRAPSAPPARWAWPCAAAGLVDRGDRGVELLEEAVEALAPSPARLEHARALVDLGAAQRRTGHRQAARERLAEGLDLAAACGAAPLAEYARAELALAGARPRRDRVTGRDALTPSELRVARIAVTGKSNREIAEELWVTQKTVETHLSRAYRKLGIKTRAELRGRAGQ